MPLKITDKDLRPAPGDLGVVQAFLNTVNHEAGVDAISTPEKLAHWLSAQGLAGPQVKLSEADLERALAVREDWRAWLRSATSVSSELCERLDQALAPVSLRLRHDADGALHLMPPEAGLDAALGRMLAVMIIAQQGKHWKRLKICGSAECRAAFYDYSTNHSNKWCTRRCGNRLSARLSRRRTRRAARERKARLQG